MGFSEWIQSGEKDYERLGNSGGWKVDTGYMGNRMKQVSGRYNP